MCQYVERTYRGVDGQSIKYDDRVPCDKYRSGRPCSNMRRASISRDETPSPINPPTPTSPGTYIVQKRCPSSGSRPSTRDGQKSIKPEIVIQIGSSKDRGSKYSSVSLSTKGYHRSSLSTGSAGSSGVAVTSPSSDASYTLRTGFPEAPLPPPAAFTNSYLPTPTVTHGYYRHTSSASSSQTPSLYVTSDHDYDPPTNQRTVRQPTIVHNPPPAGPPSPSRRQAGASSGSYRTSLIAPQGSSVEAHTPDGLSPLDYADLADRSGSSHASSGVSGSTRRSATSEERRKRKDEDLRRQEERDRQEAQDLDRAENEKHVRFVDDRAESRKAQRAEQAWAEKEKDRAIAREDARRRKEEERLARDQRELEEKAAKDRRKEKSKPPTTDYSNKRPSALRRMSASMTPAQLAEQRRLLAADGLHMQGEREAAEAREREERTTAIRQQQENSSYYDPRGGDRTLSNNPSTMARRGSISRHDSVTSAARPTGLTRTSSTIKRRNSISQAIPPPIIAQAPTEPYTTRPRTRAPPPLSFPVNFKQDLPRAPPSARRQSFTQENPFAAPPNPFASNSSILSPSSATDEWDIRNVNSALPPSRPSGEPRYNNMRERGEAVINRRANRTSRAAVEYETDSESAGEGAQPVYASRTGLSGKGRKKH